MVGNGTEGREGRRQWEEKSQQNITRMTERAKGLNSQGKSSQERWDESKKIIVEVGTELKMLKKRREMGEFRAQDKEIREQKTKTLPLSLF